MPYKVVTAGTWLRRAGTVAAVAAATGLGWLVLSVASGVVPSPVAAIAEMAARGREADAAAHDEPQAADAGDGGEAASRPLDTAAAACETIAAYYSAVAAGDATALHSIGADEAAAAAERGWLRAIGYEVRDRSVPTAARMPAPVGDMGGLPMFAIADFYDASPADAIHTVASGDGPRAGWVVFDDAAGRWMVIDPYMPTAIRMPASTTVTMRSEDGRTSVTATSAGVLSNPWWAFADIDVRVESSAPFTVSARELGGGVRESMPYGLIGRHSGDAGGTVRIEAGETSGFDPSLAGSRPVEVAGDVMPVRVQTVTQDVTPTYGVGGTEG